MDDFEIRILNHVTAERMINKSDSVTVALSGGADSVALLFSLLALSKEIGFTVSAAHYNHSLRGAESDGDEDFVKTLCESLSVPLVTEKGDVKSFSESSGKSIELAAREMRYDFLSRASNGGLIATAHNADDNAETVLHNLARGTGIKGVCGIPPVRDRIVRPFLCVARSEIEEYLKRQKQEYRTDSTNFDDKYTRNKIRHKVLPAIREINGNAVLNITRLSENLRTDNDFLESETKKAYALCASKNGLSVKKLLTFHKAVSSRVIIKYYEKEIGTVPESRHVESILKLIKDGGERVGVQRGFTAENFNGFLYFASFKRKENEILPIKSFPFSENHVIIEKYSVKETAESQKFNSLLFNNAADCDKISGELILRSRREGDKIRLRGRNVTKSLKKLFNESRIPQGERDLIPVVCDEKGIVWVSGFGIDERVSPDRNTENILIFNG